jgi:hypothetical protein
MQTKWSGVYRQMALLPLLFALASCDKTPINPIEVADHKVIADFESDPLLTNISLKHTKGSVIEGDKFDGVTQGQHAYRIDFLSKEYQSPSFILTPSTPFDWSDMGDFSLVMDLANPTDSSIHVFSEVADSKGQKHFRTVIVPKKSSGTYYIELRSPDLLTETGIRSNPPSWKSDYTPFIWRNGQKIIDVSAIEYISLKVSGLLKDKSIVVDNIRVEKNGPADTDYLVKLVDEFGQNPKIEYPNKIHSLDELRQRSQLELSELDGKLMADRSKFGGWKNGPKLDATGYFRTEKVADKWSLVDPEGHLFFSFGVANVRMANTSTITGVDFSQDYIVQRQPGDLTPEDSIGLNGVKGEGLKTAFVASELRHNMFSWLPDYVDPLAKHYGYRREVFIGATERGETFSFYQANLERKYGDNFMDKWRDVTVDRMINWGFTSFGNWIDPMFYQLNKIPYFANGWIIGDFKTVSSGNDYWAPLPDPFDPIFVERAKATVEAIAEEVQDNPWCVGVFIDNEKSWGNVGSIQSQYGVVINTLSKTDSESPSKKVFSQLMKDKYTDIAALNASWGTDIDSWQQLAQGVTLTDFTDAQVADFSTMLRTFASQYFKVVKQQLKKVMPNHLYMGARLATWGMTPEIVAAAAENVDVMSYNYYKEGMHPEQWEFLKEVDMPSVIGEFHMGATDTGLLNPGLVHAANQTERAQLYEDYMQSVANNPYFVGAHWFQYIDSPLTGRALDGENYNVGFVSATDSPYQEMVDAVKRFSNNLYPNRYGDVSKPQ